MSRTTKTYSLCLIAVICVCVGSATAQFSDNFDAYAAGSSLQGVNGWRGWNNSPGAAADVTDAQSNSPDNSVEVVGGVDLVHNLGEPASGVWQFTIDQYVPTGAGRNQFFIMLNQYGDSVNGAGPENWSVELQLTATHVTDDYGVPADSVPIIFDEWVEIRVDIDLDNDTVNQYYGGTLIGSPDQTWSTRGSGGGTTTFGALDLFSNNASQSIYYDNVNLAQVPEPSTGLMCLCGILALTWFRRR